MGVPDGALVSYVLAKYATGGSGGLLELGPTMVTDCGSRSSAPSAPGRPRLDSTPTTSCAR